MQLRYRSRFHTHPHPDPPLEGEGVAPASLDCRLFLAESLATRMRGIFRSARTGLTSL